MNPLQNGLDTSSGTLESSLGPCGHIGKPSTLSVDNQLNGHSRQKRQRQERTLLSKDAHVLHAQQEPNWNTSYCKLLPKVRTPIPSHQRYPCGSDCGVCSNLTPPILSTCKPLQSNRLFCPRNLPPPSPEGMMQRLLLVLQLEQEGPTYHLDIQAG